MSRPPAIYFTDSWARTYQRAGGRSHSGASRVIIQWQAVETRRRRRGALSQRCGGLGVTAAAPESGPNGSDPLVHAAVAAVAPPREHSSGGGAIFSGGDGARTEDAG